MTGGTGMNDKQSESSVRAVVVVVVIAAVCAAGLAFVRKTTAARIEEEITKETVAALQKVVPEGCLVDLDRRKEKWPAGAGEDTVEIVPAFNEGGNLCALAVKVRTDKGYSGRVVVLAGFSGLERVETLRLNRIYVTEHKETPGLGSLVTAKQDEEVDSWGNNKSKVFGLNFLDKPLNKATFEVKKADAGEWDVAAVTAATISSRAVAGATLKASKVLKGDLADLKEAFERVAERTGGEGGDE